MCVSSNERGGGPKDSYGGVWPAGGASLFLELLFLSREKNQPSGNERNGLFYDTKNIYKGMGKTESYFINTPSLTPVSSQASIRYAFIVIVEDSEK